MLLDDFCWRASATVFCSDNELIGEAHAANLHEFEGSFASTSYKNFGNSRSEMPLQHQQGGATLTRLSFYFRKLWTRLWTSVSTWMPPLSARACAMRPSEGEQA